MTTATRLDRPALLSTSEAARLVRGPDGRPVSDETVRRWCRKGALGLSGSIVKLTFTGVSDRAVVVLEDVEAFLRATGLDERYGIVVDDD